MKQKLSIILLITLLVSMLALTPAYAAEQQITVYIDNSPVAFDVSPVVENGRTLVPMRAIFEALNTTVEWDNATLTVTASTEYLMCLELQIGNPIALKYFISPSDDYNFETNTGTFTKDQLQEIKLDVPAKLIDGRTMVPLRFIAESMNYDVKWDGANNRVDIITGNSAALPLSEETQYKQSCAFTGFEYNDAVVNSSRHIGERRAFTGSIKAITSNTILLDNFGIVKVYMPEETIGKLYINDRCTVYGELDGTATYEGQDQFGFPKTYTVPYMVAKYADGNWNQEEFTQQSSEYAAELAELSGTWVLSYRTLEEVPDTLQITSSMINDAPYVVESAEKRRDQMNQEYLYIVIKWTDIERYPEDYDSQTHERLYPRAVLQYEYITNKLYVSKTSMYELLTPNIEYKRK